MGRWVDPFDDTQMTSDEFDSFNEKWVAENPGERMSHHEWATDEDLFDHERPEYHANPNDLDWDLIEDIESSLD